MFSSGAKLALLFLSFGAKTQ